MPSEIFGDLANTIRIKGNEFGTTTKRPRRIGWLDINVLKYSKRVSGLSFIAVTLLDVLSGLDEIKIVTSYTLDNMEFKTIPSTIDEFNRCIPNYITIPGWQEDITQVKHYDELPLNAKKYLQMIEELMGVKVAIFSVGPSRDQTIEIINIFEDKKND